MYLASEKIDIKYISEDDLIRNESVLISLLEDNLRINFSTINDLTGFAINGYKNMVYFKRDGSAILIGAFKGSAIIGFLWAYKREILGEKRIHIRDIVVTSKVRSSGIGSKLLNALENFAREKCIKKIELMETVDNEKTMKFYKSNGFSTVRIQLEKELG